MNQTLTLILLVLLIILVALIILFAAGYFTTNPSDLQPFSEFVHLINPSLLPQAKKDYNNIVLTFLRILNNQSEQLNTKSFKNYKSIINEMQPVLFNLQQKYTPDIGGKLLKYFACKHVIILLDNYYNGPPINIMIPAVPLLNIESFPFVYEPKRKRRVMNASLLAPFKYFVYNIPKKIRDEATILYDDIVYRYMMVLNETVAPLSEVNINTIKTINIQDILQKYQSMIQQDFIKIQKLLGNNMIIVIKNLFMKNIVPLLDIFYRGPGINFHSPVITNLYNTPPQVITIHYPSKNKNNIFISTPVL
jgi:hypothetical protein